jgi:hypothetical protein
MHSLRLFLAVAFYEAVSVNSFFFQKLSNTKPTKNPLLPDLANLIEESRNGVDTSTNEEVKSLMLKISESRKGDQRKMLLGQWELIYTTEKEVNVFKTSWPFAKVSIITQDLDLYEGRIIDNSINFEGGGAFDVTGTVIPVDCDSGYDRVAFEFTAAVVKGWGKSLTLPPAGAGWFDTMFCDKEYRLSQDSRGDWSVFKRL